ncbi:DsbA family protein [Agrilactobacillus fermenti]|uniref:DsbA family protein n=1 Tax=Agrilactobacillus fermenti TaxID=2586909 RepID=UPI001E50B7E6|nr:DsbA family protein [Agrilactobacillus fermenti]MCD2255458.1 DsbA family protein [Agrilactobacillus fermenti]
MLELFLFVNPIGCQCLNAENILLKLVSEFDSEIKYKFIPVVSLPVIGKYMSLKHFDPTNLQLRNQLTNWAYSASLDYKAASFQGNRKSRNFLIALQTLINDEGRSYNKETITTALKSADLDIALFREDRQDSLIQELYREDEHFISEMKVVDAPTAVIYNYCSEQQDTGVLIENCDSYDLLHHVFDRMLNLDADQSIIEPETQNVHTLNFHTLP